MMKADKPETVGLYLHVPFCLGKCLYCDFYSGAFPPERRREYVRALCTQLRAWAGAVREFEVDTVYLGGGTPTLLLGEELSKILGVLREAYRVRQDAEITVECNPATLEEDKARLLFKAGVNRMSIGVQSMQDNELRALGRRHTAANARRTVRMAQEAGFRNLSVDLMLGIPEQTPASLSATLDAVLSLGLTHISAYGLRIEEGTPFFAQRHVLSLPDEDTEVALQELVERRLREAGFCHYEISNYARPGYASRHNLRYWRGEPYLGFGPGAHSYLNNTRFSTPPSLDAYLDAVRRADWSALCVGAERIEGKEEMDEYVMLRMRLAEGVNEADFAHRFGTSMEKAYGDLSRLESGGFLVHADGRVAFTEKGFSVSNAILSDWLDFGRA